MEELNVVARKWGNSLAIVLPKNVVKSNGIKENEDLIVTITRKATARDIFGLLKDWKKPTQKIKDEMREGW